MSRQSVQAEGQNQGGIDPTQKASAIRRRLDEAPDSRIAMVNCPKNPDGTCVNLGGADSMIGGPGIVIVEEGVEITARTALPWLIRFFDGVFTEQGLKTAGEIGGKIIGWGAGQAAEDVAQTARVTNELTEPRVAEMIRKGLKREWVQGQLNKYLDSLAKAGGKLKNKQLMPRIQLMQKILTLWPK